jgi:hypothetical protein
MKPFNSVSLIRQLLNVRHILPPGYGITIKQTIARRLHRQIPTSHNTRHMTHKEARRLVRGDIVEVEWYDTHSTERLTHEDIDDLEEPAPTLAYGLVLKNGPAYITLASEICLDPFSDGSWVEQIPHGAIRRTKRLSRRALETDGEVGVGRI